MTFDQACRSGNIMIELADRHEDYGRDDEYCSDCGNSPCRCSQMYEESKEQ
jgi:hypothetical protein